MASLLGKNRVPPNANSHEPVPSPEGTPLRGDRTDQGDLRDGKALSQRIGNEFHEIPGLCLTVPQASRFFGVAEDVCQQVLAQLAEEGVLQRAGSHYRVLRKDFVGRALVTSTTDRHYR
jgi:hypothetical protein